jgi:arylsulfatase A-like enzyme
MLALLATCLFQQVLAPEVPALDAATPTVERPNILWLSFEDHGPQLGCYGDDYAETPVLDGLAASGVRYERCWSNAPVCSTARTTLITGRYATSLGAHHHRSRLPLPEDVHFFPQLLREAGYFCTNNRKEDYNLDKPKGTWDMSGNSAHWRKRAPGQPFFAVVNVTVSHESQIRKRPHELVHDPAEFELPPYYPDLPEIRRDWAQEYDKGTEMDTRLGQILAQLREDGLEEDTIIFAFGDHGSGMPRHKRWPGDSGQRVPLILVVPDKWKHLRPEGYESGALLERLVAFVDFGPTVLSLAEVQADAGMQGVPFLGKFNGPDKKYLFGYRGRMDERDDEVRVITDGRYVYMWNLDGARPHGAHVSYQFETPTTKAWYEYARDHPDAPAAIRDYWFGNRGRSDLFDLDSDPHEVFDLSTNEEHESIRESLRAELMSLLRRELDLGVVPEHLLMKELARGGKIVDDLRWIAFQFEHSGAALRGSDDAVARWWAMIRARELARQDSEHRDDFLLLDDRDAGVRVLASTAQLLLTGPARNSSDQQGRLKRGVAWNTLMDSLSSYQPNYFVRLLAWQAMDEVISSGALSAQELAGMRKRIEFISTDHPDLDGAFRNYLPRLKEKVLAELASD